MGATWCNERQRWIVRHPQRPADVIAVGRTKDEAQAAADERMRVERERRL